MVAEKKDWKKMKNSLLMVLISATVIVAQDVEMVQGYFKSENNLVEEIHMADHSNKEFLVLRLKTKLTGKNSRARVIADKRPVMGIQLPPTPTSKFRKMIVK